MPNWIRFAMKQQCHWYFLRTLCIDLHIVFSRNMRNTFRRDTIKSNDERSNQSGAPLRS